MNKADLALLLVEHWEWALADAAGLVDEAAKQAEISYRATGINKTLEDRSFMSEMGVARGYLRALRKLKPGDSKLTALWERLNHCPVIALDGPDPQLRLVK